MALLVEEIAQEADVEHHLVQDPRLRRGLHHAVAQGLNDHPQGGHRVAHVVRERCLPS